MTVLRRGSRLLLVGVMALSVGCQGGDDGGAGGDQTGGEAIEVTALDNEFDPTEVEVPEGEVTIRFTNDGTNSHTFTIESLGVDTDTVEPGQSTTVTFDAPTERTEFICKIHYESADMEGFISPA